MEEQKQEQEPVKIQSVQAIFFFVLINGLKSIVGFIAVSLFKPIWNWIIKSFR